MASLRRLVALREELDRVIEAIGAAKRPRPKLLYKKIHHDLRRIRQEAHARHHEATHGSERDPEYVGMLKADARDLMRIHGLLKARKYRTAARHISHLDSEPRDSIPQRL